jgi:hypothetical protein
MSRFTSAVASLGGWPPRGSVKCDPPYDAFAGALGAKLFSTEPAPFAASRDSYKGGGMHDCFIVGAPPSGRSVLAPSCGHSPRVAAPTRAAACTTALLWEPRPRGEAFQTPSRRHSPRVATPTKAAACTTAFVGAPPSGRSFSDTEPAPFVASRDSYKGGGMHDCFIVGTPRSGRSFSDTEPAPFAAGRDSYKGGGMHDCFVVGSPALGTKLFRHRAGAIRRGSRLLQGRRHARLLFVGAPPSGRSF